MIQADFSSFLPDLLTKINASPQLDPQLKNYLLQLLAPLASTKAQEAQQAQEKQQQQEVRSKLSSSLEENLEQLLYRDSITQLIVAREDSLPRVKTLFAGRLASYYLRVIELYGQEKRYLSAITIVRDPYTQETEWFQELTAVGSMPLGTWLFAQPRLSSSFSYQESEPFLASSPVRESSFTRGRYFLINPEDSRPSDRLYLIERLEVASFLKLFTSLDNEKEEK